MSAGAARGGGLRPLRTSLENWAPGRGAPIDPLHAIAAAWPAIVGRDVAANAAPLELAGENLVIGTRSSAWSQQLQFLSLQILAQVRALPAGIVVSKLVFRTGLLPRGRRRVAAAASPRPPSGRATLDPTPPAVDVYEAFARLRARMTAAPKANGSTCADCGLPVAPSAGAARDRCAPCAGNAELARRTQIERIVYMAPWLTFVDLREQVPDLSVAEFERARKVLLQRWWLVLERARAAGRVSRSGLERHVGSSYVLLQSRLPPDRITSAVVRNLLGADLEILLWPHAVAPPPPVSGRPR